MIFECYIISNSSISFDECSDMCSLLSRLPSVDTKVRTGIVAPILQISKILVFHKVIDVLEVSRFCFIRHLDFLISYCRYVFSLLPHFYHHC